MVRFALTSAMVTGCHAPDQSLAPVPASSPTALAPSTATPPALPTEAYFTHWEYHYNRNALTASAMVEGDVIAITAAGHLLRFNAETLKLESELLSRRMARVLGGATDHDVLVGFQSGRIARLAVPTLELTTIASVPGVPSWIGVSKGELLVIYGRAGALPHFSGLAPKLRRLGSGREVSVPKATAFFLDAEDRLWLGEDHGEWGGALTRVDLKGGQAVGVPWPTAEAEDIYGFAEVAPGEVWALGGVQHMMSDAFVLRIAPDPTPTTIFSRTTPMIVRPRTPAKPTESPGMPITHVVDDRGGKLIAFAYDGVYETDRKAHFRRLGAIHLKYHPGRPDAVGSYPALSNVLVATNRLILTTKLDGLVTWRPGAPAFHALAGELGVEPEGIVPSRDLLLIEPFHAARWNGQSWTLQTLPTGDDERSQSAPANTDADRALAVELAAYRQDARAQARWRVHGNHRIHDSIGWDAQHVLLATERGLCLLPLDGTDECSPFAPVGLDDVVRRLKRDDAGRLWLAGRGLWYLRDSQHAVSVHRRLPFTADTEIADLAIRGDTLVLALGARGVALLKLADLVELPAGAVDPPVAAWDDAQRHEPRHSDGAVRMELDRSASKLEAEGFRQLVERLDDLVSRSALDWSAPDEYPSAGLLLFSPDPNALAAFVVQAVEKEPLRPRLHISKRLGPNGAAWVEVR